MARFLNNDEDSLRWYPGKSVLIENTWVRAIQNRIRIVRHGDSSEDIDAQLSKIEDDGRRKSTSETSIAKLWRCTRENWNRSSGQESWGNEWRWRRAGYQSAPSERVLLLLERALPEVVHPVQYGIVPIRITLPRTDDEITKLDARHGRIESGAVVKSRMELICVEGGKGICYQWKKPVRKETNAVSGMRVTIVHKIQNPKPPRILSHPCHEVEVCRGRGVSEAKVTMVPLFDNRADISWKEPARNRLVNIGILPSVNFAKQKRSAKPGISVCSRIIVRESDDKHSVAILKIVPHLGCVSRIVCNFSDYVPFVVVVYLRVLYNADTYFIVFITGFRIWCQQIHRKSSTKKKWKYEWGATWKPAARIHRNRKHKNEGREEEQSDILHDLPDWQKDFKENLVDERNPSESPRNPEVGHRDTSSSSHDLPTESRAKVEPGSGKHSVYTHFPKDRKLRHLSEDEHYKAAGRRRAGSAPSTLEPEERCLDENWWADSTECYTYLRNVTDLLLDGKTPNERRFGQPFKGPIIPYGSLVEYYPKTAKDQSRIHQFGQKVLPGCVPRIRSVRGVTLEGWRTGCRPWGVGDDGRIRNLF